MMGYVQLDEHELGKVKLTYLCDSCLVEAEVDPTFFETSGTPICSDCGEDMNVTQVEVVL